MTGQRRKQAQMGEHGRMNRTEVYEGSWKVCCRIFPLQSGRKHYNTIMNILMMRVRKMNRTLLRALGNPAKVAENIKKDIFGERLWKRIFTRRSNADNRAVITYPADSGGERGAGEAGFEQENEAHAAGAVSSPEKKECPPV